MSLAAPVKASLNRIAFITGAGQGIGRAIALRLARDGYDVSIADIPSAKEKVNGVLEEIKSYGRQAISVDAGQSSPTPCSTATHCVHCLVDVREPKQIEAAIAQTVEQLGPRLYVSVANAGITQVRPLLECTPEYVPVCCCGDLTFCVDGFLLQVHRERSAGQPPWAHEHPHLRREADGEAGLWRTHPRRGLDRVLPHCGEPRALWRHEVRCSWLHGGGRERMGAVRYPGER